MTGEQGPKRPATPIDALRMYLFKCSRPEADDSQITALFDALSELDDHRRGIKQ